MSQSPDESSPPAANPFRYVHSADFPALLEQLGLSLAVTTYQAGKLMLVRSAGGRLSTLLRSFEKAMGLAVTERCDRMVLGTLHTVWTLFDAPDIAPQLEPKGRHDACFVPRVAHVTGDMHGHEIAVADGAIWIVNTLFSCLCTLDDARFTFVPRWKPPFVDRLAGEDRCHLNGIAVEDGRVAYATAMGATNTANGWREGKLEGGVVLEVPTGEVVSRGLCMPHSPRVHGGKLFVLDSGKGLLCTIDESNGQRTTVAALPGFARGLAFAGRYAFVGLSKVREKDLFSGIPIAATYDEAQRKCGVCAVDLETGALTAFLWFEEGCSELFDVQTLPGKRWPTAIGFQDETIRGIMVAPPEVWGADPRLPARP